MDPSTPRAVSSGTARLTLGQRWADLAQFLSILAVPFWLCSLVWVPFALLGRIHTWVGFLVFMGAAASGICALSAIFMGWQARRKAPAGSSAQRKAARAIWLGLAVLLLSIGGSAGVYFFLR